MAGGGGYCGVSLSRPASLLEIVLALPGATETITHIEHLPGREAVFAPWPDGLHPAARDVLVEAGIARPYRHQADAIRAALAGEHVAIATATASGKTLCYNAPVIDALVREREARALYLFPTKALAQDQLRALRQLLAAGLRGVQAATYDGDTPQQERTALRKSAQLLLTNPDMLNVGLLPNHVAWGPFLKRLRYVIVDEAHTYRGVFGSHVALILRRLQRLAAQYGARPRFILASATLGNAAAHASQLIGAPVTVVAEDGAPHGPRQFVFVHPPLLDRASGTRRSANAQAMEVLVTLVQHGVRTLLFTRTRRLAELVLAYARERLAGDPLAERLMAYRAGYLAEDRREIERRLFSGELLGVTATNALELGIDIGDLDAVVLAGYPGSNASTWQQAGRAGRGREESLAVLVAQDNPMDEYVVTHPELVVKGALEHALVNPANPYVLAGHLVAAAYESPLTERDDRWFPPQWREILAELEVGGLVHRRPRGWFPSASIAYPAQDLNIRSTGGEPFLLVEAGSGRVLELVAPEMAAFELYPGAVYLHQGESWLVERLDLLARTATARQERVEYYTQTRDVTELAIRQEVQARPCAQTVAHLGLVEVTNGVVSFQRRRQYTGELIGEEALDLPERTYETMALWYDIPDGVVTRLQQAGADFAGALHAAEHASIGLLPLFALCDRRDIGGLSTTLHADTGAAQVFIYDGHPGGVGIAERGFEALEGLLTATLELLEACPCEAGCPRCVQSPKCGNNNDTLDKAGAMILLATILGVDRSSG